MNRQTHTIIGCDSSYEDSGMVIFGAPFDSTTSYRPGARFASAAIRQESYGMETYSPIQDKDLTDYHFFDYGDLELPFGEPQGALAQIEAMADRILADGKRPFMIGGEHLVTYGAVKSAVKHYPDLAILHLDAHADLRDDYLGVRFSHATVMRRCHELVGDNRIFQFGIRSGDREEFRWGKGHVSTCKFNFATLPEALLAIGSRPVYLTLDLDILDPSAFPGTGTPEAGGVSFQELLSALTMIAQCRIVGLDMNELSPPYDTSGVSTATACKLLRELLLLIGGNN